MRIALVLTGGLHPSGRDQVIPVWLWLIERLARDHVVHAFTVRHLPEHATYSLAGATVHDLGRPEGRWAQWKALRRALVREGPFDVIHGYWADPAGLLAAIAGRRLGIPSLVTCDSGEFASLPDIDYGLQRSSRGRALVGLACRLATRVHVTSRFMASLAREHGVEAVSFPLGVDLSRVTDAPSQTTQSRIGGAPWCLLQVASLNPVKDQPTLLRALATARQRVDIRLDLAGEDTFGDGRLQRDAAALGLGDAVRFHGFVPSDMLNPLRATSHLYVQSSRHEAAGVSVLEAAAAGLPVVGTGVGYVSDWAPHGAVAVPSGDSDALAAAIIATLENAGERDRLRREAKRFAVAHDADWSAARLIDLYESVAGRAGGARRAGNI